MRKKNLEDLYDFHYLTNKVNEADEKKHILLKCLYELGNISYEKGSRPGDYAIRDRVIKIREVLTSYYETIKIFDSGKNGDIKAYEDIMVFFENSFIDSYLLGDQVIALKSEISSQKEEDRRHNEKHAGTPIERKKNIYVTDLEKQIKALEFQLQTKLIPHLHNFLNDVNLILLFEKIKSLLEQVKKSINTLNDSLHTAELKNFLMTFLWLYHKINLGVSKKKQIPIFIEEILDSMGFTSSLGKYMDIDPKGLSDLFKEIAEEFDVLLLRDIIKQDQMGNNRASTPIQKEITVPSLASANEQIQLLAFLKRICRFDVYGLSAIHISEPHKVNIIVGTKERNLFHTPGLFQVSLKTLSDYVVNSLIFIGTWLVRELRHNSIPFESLQTILVSYKKAEEFVQAYETALYISSQPENQFESTLTGEIQQYISKHDAEQLKYLINRTCDEMNESFINASIELMLHPFHGSDGLLKRIHLAQESFIDAKNKIEKGNT